MLAKLDAAGEAVSAAPDEAARVAAQVAAAAGTRQPACISGVTMRQYQLDGLRWIAARFAEGVHGILADEVPTITHQPPNTHASPESRSTTDTN